MKPGLQAKAIRRLVGGGLRSFVVGAKPPAVVQATSTSARIDAARSISHDSGGVCGIGSVRHASSNAEQESALPSLSTDLVALAQMDQLDPVFGREKEIQRAMRILCRRRKSNLCLIGEPGVGKTCIVDGLAQAIARGDVPDNMLGKRVLSLDIGLCAAHKAC